MPHAPNTLFEVAMLRDFIAQRPKRLCATDGFPQCRLGDLVPSEPQMVSSCKHGDVTRARRAWLSPALLIAALSPVALQTSEGLSCNSGDTTLAELAIVVGGEDQIEFQPGASGATRPGCQRVPTSCRFGHARGPTRRPRCG